MKQTKSYITYKEMEHGELFDHSKISKLELMVEVA